MILHDPEILVTYQQGLEEAAAVLDSSGQFKAGTKTSDVMSWHAAIGISNEEKAIISASLSPMAPTKETISTLAEYRATFNVRNIASLLLRDEGAENLGLVIIDRGLSVARQNTDPDYFEITQAEHVSKFFQRFIACVEWSADESFPNSFAY